MPYYGEGPLRVEQVGHGDRCAKANCGKGSQYRLIMSGHAVQVYVCTDHLPWGVNLDCHRDREWAAMGVAQRQTHGAGVMVIPELGPITRLDYSRPLDFAATYPVPGVARDFGDGLPTYIPVFREEQGVSAD